MMDGSPETWDLHWLEKDVISLFRLVATVSLTADSEVQS